MGLESLSAISSTLVAGPSGTKKSKGKGKTNSDAAKQNPFGDAITQKEEASRKTLALKNFNTATKLKKLEFKECPKALPLCDDEYVYHPEPAETCGNFRLKFNIPNDYDILHCGEDGKGLTTTTIKAEDLKKFVGLKK